VDEYGDASVITGVRSEFRSADGALSLFVWWCEEPNWAGGSPLPVS